MTRIRHINRKTTRTEVAIDIPGRRRLPLIAIFMATCIFACSEKLLTPVIVVQDTATTRLPLDTATVISPDTTVSTAPDTQSTATDTHSTPIDTATDFDTATQTEPQSDSDSLVDTDSHPDTLSDSAADTDTGTFQSTDSGTHSDSGTIDSTDSHTATDTDTTATDTADTETVTGTATDTHILQDSDTLTETDSIEVIDTDTYSYVYVPEFSHVGFAAVPALDVSEFGFNPADATTVEATSIDEINAAIANRDGTPLIIYISGTLISEENAQIIIDNERDVQLIGRITTSLQGIGVTVRDSANILIQNLSIHHVVGSNDDCINIENSHHIWIDHCDVYNDRSGSVEYDGLLDITHGSDYITVSWNHFHENLKGLIAGHSNSNGDEDSGKLHITYHHNIFSNISPGPISVRFGQAHVFNNLFRYDFGDSTIGISARMTACVRAELNRFRGVNEPLKTDQSGDTPDELGRIEALQNVDDNGSVGPIAPECQLAVPYEYTHTVTDTTYLEALLYQNIGIDRLR
ncbi:MAG: hypothetical protein JXX14_12150 [Deltaproteobacteria bacterium]|nr:hypothetical protein [Deltaproteobacteria bacterium]